MEGIRGQEEGRRRTERGGHRRRGAQAPWPEMGRLRRQPVSLLSAGQVGDLQSLENQTRNTFTSVTAET